jgi:hypothetical protein
MHPDTAKKASKSLGVHVMKKAGLLPSIQKELSPDMDCLLEKLRIQMKKEHIVDINFDELGNLEMSVMRREHITTRLP